MPATPQTVVDAFVANTTDTAANSKIVRLSNGNSLATYATENVTNGGFTVRGQQFDPFGNPVGEETTLPFAGVQGFGNSEFDIVSLGDNEVVIVGLGLFDSLSIREFEVTDDGVEIFDSRAMVDAGISSSKDFFSPTITGLDDGRYKVERANSQDDESGLALGRLDKTFDGSVSAEITFSRFSGTLVAEIDSDTLVNGNRVLILDRDDADGRIHFQVTGPDRSTVASGETGGRNPNSRIPKVTVTALKRDGFVLAWFHEDSLDSDVQYQVFNSDGTPRTVQSEFAFAVNDGLHNNNETAIAALEDGGFIIFYDKDRGTPQIRGQRFDSDGIEMGDDFLVVNENGAQIDATTLPDGRIAVTYKVVGAGIVQVEILDIDPFPTMI